MWFYHLNFSELAELEFLQVFATPSFQMHSHKFRINILETLEELPQPEPEHNPLKNILRPDFGNAWKIRYNQTLPGRSASSNTINNILKATSLNIFWKAIYVIVTGISPNIFIFVVSIFDSVGRKSDNLWILLLPFSSTDNSCGNIHIRITSWMKQYLARTEAFVLAA